MNVQDTLIIRPLEKGRYCSGVYISVSTLGAQTHLRWVTFPQDFVNSHRQFGLCKCLAVCSSYPALSARNKTNIRTRFYGFMIRICSKRRVAWAPQIQDLLTWPTSCDCSGLNQTLGTNARYLNLPTLIIPDSTIPLFQGARVTEHACSNLQVGSYLRTGTRYDCLGKI